jgi:DNA-binding HxlR family transcriptional regulator
VSSEKPSKRARVARPAMVDIPIRVLLDQIADKWSVLILGALCHGPLRFNELKRRLDGISQKALAAALKTLEKNGIVSRKVLVQSPIAVEYEITKLGRTLEAPFAALHAWAEKHSKRVAEARESYDATCGVDQGQSGSRR